MQSPKQKIEEAFYKLNPQYEIRDRTMNEILFIGTSQHAETLLHKNPPFPGMLASRHPAAWKECSLNTAAKQLQNLKRSAKKLKADIEKMNQPTISALVKSGFHTLDLEQQLSLFLGECDGPGTADAAIKYIENWKIREPNLASFKSGAPKDKIALHITMILAEEYFRATGNSPSVSNKEHLINKHQTGNKSYGEFLDFVAAIFCAIGIKASPEAMARSAIDLWRKREKSRSKHLLKRKVRLKKCT